MRFTHLHSAALALALVFGCTFLPVQQTAYCQETTGGLQGTVKDPSGAVIPGARVVVTGNTMIGNKVVVTDSSGYYRFANLPPGTYKITVTAKGFDSLQQSGIALGVGRLPTIDLTLKVGGTTAVVEVTGQSPLIDETSNTTMTELPAQALQNLPTGVSYQSVIQFAPMARNEPLSGMSVSGQGSGGTGGSMPGSSGNGLGFGYMIGGAADSESSYLVEGMDTESLSGGYSKANVPMDFVQDVQIKTSGISAQYGGALGGVVNAILKKGSNNFHGEVFSTYESSGTDANQINPFVRYDPTDLGTDISDPAAQVYQAKKDHFRDIQPGVLIGGPIYKNRLWFVAGFNPLYSSIGRTVNFGSQDENAGLQYFTQDRQTYYGYGRLDAELSSKVRVYGLWLTQYARETGDSLPIGDPIPAQSTFLNTSTFSPLTQFSHGHGWVAPNATYNFGADVTLTQHLVSTTRYGYFFDNYHSFGWPTTAPDLVWATSGQGATDNTGNPLPAGLAQPTGTSTTPYDSTYTLFNADKHYQFNQDFAIYHGGWGGTHNLQFGYQLNHLVNVISQNGNVPQAFMVPGSGKANAYSPATQTGIANCDLLSSKNSWGTCQGQYGYMFVQDFATVLAAPASDWNHAFYVQDSWTIARRLTLDLGLRIEKEDLPAPAGIKVSAIHFPWSDKIEPRLGAAWDPTGSGKMKIFGSYGVVNDVMKLLLAQTSWGAQAFETCAYALGPDGTTANYDNSDIDLVFKGGRACPSGPATTGANFANGQTPSALTDANSGVSLIENVNFRPWEPVAPNVKPYRQHEYVFGWDYQISPNTAFEVRYDRRRLDHVLEDASLADPNFFEIYTIVNPGEGVNRTIDGYANYLTSLGSAYGVPGIAFNDTADYGPSAAFGTCPSCPPNPKAVRNYDGVEFRFMLAPRNGLSGMFSYTYSSLWGNYTGLTTTDQSDGGITGRNSPDTTRSFDEPFFYYGANGKSNNGALPTDRPNTLKGYLYYTLPWKWKHQSTTFGLFQTAYQGTPLGSYIDLAFAGYSEPIESTFVFGRDKWVDITTDPSTGAITLGLPHTRRTPWFTQSDFNVKHEIQTGEHENISFEATATNLLNERKPTTYYEGMNSINFETALYPGLDSSGAPVNFGDGAELYNVLEHGYNVQQWINGNNGQVPSVIKDSQYGKPYLFQLGRSIRLAVHYTF